MLQPKWDGFRLLVTVDGKRHVQAWSRRGVRLDEHLQPLLAAFTQAPTGAIFDGELVALKLADGVPVQDFATVGHGALHGHSAAVSQLHYVAFDLLSHDGEDTVDSRGQNATPCSREHSPQDHASGPSSPGPLRKTSTSTWLGSASKVPS